MRPQAIRQLLHCLRLQLIHLVIRRIKLLAALTKRLLKGPHLVTLVTEVLQILLHRALGTQPQETLHRVRLRTTQAAHGHVGRVAQTPAAARGQLLEYHTLPGEAEGHAPRPHHLECILGIGKLHALLIHLRSIQRKALRPVRGERAHAKTLLPKARAHIRNIHPRLRKAGHGLVLRVLEHKRRKPTLL